MKPTLVGGLVQMQINNTGSLSFAQINEYVYIIEPWHGISNNMVCATSKASDQPAHTRSLIRTFASRLNIL